MEEIKFDKQGSNTKKLKEKNIKQSLELQKLSSANLISFSFKVSCII